MCCIGGRVIKTIAHSVCDVLPPMAAAAVGRRGPPPFGAHRVCTNAPPPTPPPPPLSLALGATLRVRAPASHTGWRGECPRPMCCRRHCRAQCLLSPRSLVGERMTITQTRRTKTIRSSPIRTPVREARDAFATQLSQHVVRHGPRGSLLLSCVQLLSVRVWRAPCCGSRRSTARYYKGVRRTPAFAPLPPLPACCAGCARHASHPYSAQCAQVSQPPPTHPPTHPHMP